MEFERKYQGGSTVRQTAGGTALSFAPDLLREPTYFVGSLGRKVAYREAMSALHAVVKSDLRFKREDKTDYKAWAAEQEQLWLAEHMTNLPDLRNRIAEVRTDLEAVRKDRSRVMKPFWAAQNKWRRHMWTMDYDARFILDPVITIHPDELFFECFSQDESTYGKLSLDYNQFERVDTFACGTTNVDYSDALYTEFQKIRTYKQTDLRVEPSGFTVTTEREADFKEEKIDLPDSWVRGFLQVSTAMTMPAVSFDLHPTDLANILFVLRQKRAKQGPRYMRFELTPGQAVKINFQPWGKIVDCPRSPYLGDVARSVKVWGRRRLLVLERLLPLADSVRIHLLGDGQPSFFLLKLGGMTFTLGMSGWTENDWSRAGQFNLMTARVNYTPSDLDRSYQALRDNWFRTTDQLVTATGFDRAKIHGLMSEHARAGNVIYDLNKGVYRARELSKDGIPLETLRHSSEVEQEAFILELGGHVNITGQARLEQGETVAGQVNDGGVLHKTLLRINEDKQLTDANCSCDQYKANGLRLGPCRHMLALRMHAGT